MRDPQRQRRFEELDAARALGNLSTEETEELASLIETDGFRPDADLDWIVAALEADPAVAPEPIEAPLREKLLSDANEFSAAPPATKLVSFFQHPAIGWAVAACVALFFILQGDPEPTETKDPTPGPSLAESREILLNQGSTLQLEFSGTDEFADLSGNVIWGDAQQEGYMSLSGLPANDPAVSQYQLWIVDPERDSVPVDGGVFDIPSADGSTIIPIAATLAVKNPAAFVITVEKPGGVMVSKQEKVAAIAARAS